MKNNLLITILIAAAFASCKKDPAATTAINSKPNVTYSVVRNLDGTTTATLQPDATNGQDVHVYDLEGSPEVANTNFNTLPELDISAWTVGGNIARLRVYMNFVDLINIPSNANVISATLYLYGVSISISSPQGNYGNNACLVEAVNSHWDQDTITWNTQPKVRDRREAKVPKSTSQFNYDAVVNVTPLVRYGVKHPDENFGVRIKLITEQIYRNVVFASCEATDPALHPKLVVVYQ